MYDVYVYILYRGIHLFCLCVYTNIGYISVLHMLVYYIIIL